MTISQTTERVVEHAARDLDLSGSVAARIPVPRDALSGRVVLTKTLNGSWGGSVPVTGNTGALSPAVSIADPGASALVASVLLGVDQLDGLDELVVGPLSGGSGIVRVRCEFTVVKK